MFFYIFFFIYLHSLFFSLSTFLYFFPSAPQPLTFYFPLLSPHILPSFRSLISLSIFSPLLPSFLLSSLVSLSTLSPFSLPSCDSASSSRISYLSLSSPTSTPIILSFLYSILQHPPRPLFHPPYLPLYSPSFLSSIHLILPYPPSAFHLPPPPHHPTCTPIHSTHPNPPAIHPYQSHHPHHPSSTPIQSITSHPSIYPIHSIYPHHPHPPAIHHHPPPSTHIHPPSTPSAPLPPARARNELSELPCEQSLHFSEFMDGARDRTLFASSAYCRSISQCSASHLIHFCQEELFLSFFSFVFSIFRYFVSSRIPLNHSFSLLLFVFFPSLFCPLFVFPLFSPTLLA